MVTVESLLATFDTMSKEEVVRYALEHIPTQESRDAFEIVVDGLSLETVKILSARMIVRTNRELG
jgi:hypothetical protein